MESERVSPIEKEKARRRLLKEFVNSIDIADLEHHLLEVQRAHTPFDLAVSTFYYKEFSSEKYFSVPVFNYMFRDITNDTSLFATIKTRLQKVGVNICQISGIKCIFKKQARYLISACGARNLIQAYLDSFSDSSKSL